MLLINFLAFFQLLVLFIRKCAMNIILVGTIFSENEAIC